MRSCAYVFRSVAIWENWSSAASSGGDCRGLQFGYDVWAKLLSATTTKCAPPNLNVAATAKNQLSGFCYDSAGNLAMNTPCPQPPGTPFTPTFAYDAENRLTQSVVSGVTATYVYDGDGRRVKKPNGKLYWYGLGADPQEEKDFSGTPSADFILFNEKRTRICRYLGYTPFRSHHFLLDMHLPIRYIRAMCTHYKLIHKGARNPTRGLAPACKPCTFSCLPVGEFIIVSLNPVPSAGWTSWT